MRPAVLSPRLEQRRLRLLEEFECVAARCEDHCCGSWVIRVDEPAMERFGREAPDVLASVVVEDGLVQLRHDAESGCCVHFGADRLCGLQKRYGESMLVDACTLFPRRVLRVGSTALVSASASCPEIARLALFGDRPLRFAPSDRSVRLPASLAEDAIGDQEASEVLAVAERFVVETEREDLDAAMIAWRLVVVSKLLEQYRPRAWPKIVESTFAHAEDSTVFEPPPADAEPLQAVLAFAELKSGSSPRWGELLRSIELSFHPRILETGSLDLVVDEARARRAERPEVRARIERVLKRFLGIELVRTMLPYFSANGRPSDQAMILAGKLIFVRTALIATLTDDARVPTEAESVTIVQTICRSLGHLQRDVVGRLGSLGLLEPARIRTLLLGPSSASAPAPEDELTSA